MTNAAITVSVLAAPEEVRGGQHFSSLRPSGHYPWSQNATLAMNEKIATVKD